MIIPYYTIFENREEFYLVQILLSFSSLWYILNMIYSEACLAAFLCDFGKEQHHDF